MYKRSRIVWAIVFILFIQTGVCYSQVLETVASETTTAEAMAPETAVDGAYPTLLISSPVLATGSALQTDKKVTAEADSVKCDAKSAVLVDAGTGTVLYEKNSHEKLPPASVTKVMTMLLVMEAIESGQITLQDMVTISERAASMGGSQLYMEAGEQHDVETLMKGISIASANDACVAMAEFVGGTEEGFVNMMNERAKELGMNDTNFVNTNGLPVPNHYTSAYDIGLMSKELMRFDEPKKWFAIWTDTIQVGKGEKKPKTNLGITNTNKLIKQYPGANGIKTGFTQEAGYCLSGSATKGDLTLIAVIMGGATSKVRFAEAGRLLDYGFALYDNVPIAKKGDVIAQIKVDKGKEECINAVTGEHVNLLTKKGEKDSVKAETAIDESIHAPIQKGQKIGEMIIYKDGMEVARHDLLAENGVEKAGLLTMYIKVMRSIF